MRKVTGLVMATGLVIALAVGCGQPSHKNMVQKLQTEAQQLDKQNYKSTALMTVQMDNSSQTYYIETWYESPNVYRIALGDGNKNINQVIVRNENGMFIVSPALQKVFRFNGNWAQNQGHIYLYDQILQQIVNADHVKMAKAGGNYTFDMPINPTNDVVVKQHVEIDARTMDPKKVVLYDKGNKAVVTIDFKSFDTGVKFQNAEFDPHKIASSGQAAKATIAQDSQFGYVEPNETFGDKLQVAYPEEQDDALLRYSGVNGFTLEEFRPAAGVDGLTDAQLIDLYGVPAVYTGGEEAHAHQLIWLNNGVQYSLTSSNLSMDQMKQVAVSTFGMVGK